jgi:hypothetical protein
VKNKKRIIGEQKLARRAEIERIKARDLRVANVIRQFEKVRMKTKVQLEKWEIDYKDEIKTGFVMPES